MQNPMIENWVQFMHLEKLYGYLPGMDEELLARLFGLDIEEYRGVRERFDANAHSAARELLEDDSFARRVDRLPFRVGDKVMGIGDSMTDDSQSWLEIVRHLLELRRPQDGIRTINMGLSAHTTAMVLRRFVSYLSPEPDWIVCFLGGGDATRVGPEPNKTQASPEETSKNLEAIRCIAAKLTDARWVWITPPTFHEERAAAYPPFRMGQSHWRNEDVLAIGDIIREQKDPVVDIQALFGTPADPELQGQDGVHPSLAGQKAIARVFVERLTS